MGEVEEGVEGKGRKREEGRIEVNWEEKKGKKRYREGKEEEWEGEKEINRERVRMKKERRKTRGK